jgi:hypothetical protein
MVRLRRLSIVEFIGAPSSRARSTAPACVALAGAVLIAFGSAAAAQEPLVAKCEGPLGRNATRADVMKAFGQNAVDERVDHDGAEEKLRATVLYAQDPKRRLEIIWEDQRARRRPTIRITGESTWTTPHGIRLGMTLADIERLNGKPFRLYGYEWDLGGRTTNWQGGALGKPLPGGCRLRLSIGIDDESIKSPHLDKVSGDTEYLSSNPDIRALKPKVFIILLEHVKR